jgi:hypothetical protein
MSNAIIGIALPANVVDMVRWMLADLINAPDSLSVAVKLGEVYGSLMTLERLQRLNHANAGRIYQHAADLAREREKVLMEKQL